MLILKFPVYLMILSCVRSVTVKKFENVDNDKRLNHVKKRSITNQEKRDLSLSYSATNIDSKEGTRVKTITVIKNIDDKKSGKLHIDPALYKNEDWATAFRDNFETYGKIPDVPNIDKLLAFADKSKHNNDDTYETNNKKQRKTLKIDYKNLKADNIKQTKEMSENDADESLTATVLPVNVRNGEITLVENTANSDSKSEAINLSSVLKDTSKVVINYNDTELLPSSSNLHNRIRTQLFTSINYLSKNKTPSPTIYPDVYSPSYTYIEQHQKPIPNNTYEYFNNKAKNVPVNSIAVKTSSGRIYNIPNNNNSNNSTKYLAPLITRKQFQNISQPPSLLNLTNFPSYSLASLIPQNFQGYPPELQQQIQKRITNSSTSLSQLQPQLPDKQLQTKISSTSQRPYLAPHIRSGLSGISRGAPSTRNINGKLNASRTRGLKY